MRWDIGIDMGENNVRLALFGRGTIVNAPSLIAMRSGKPVAIGEDALEMWGRAPDDISIVRPIANARIENAAACALWMDQLVGRHVSRLKKPSVLIAAPRHMPQSDLTALTASVMAKEAGQCGIISADIASALGADVDVRSPGGKIIIDIGAGQIGAAILSYGRIISSHALPYGMNRIDHAIMALLKDRHALTVGMRTAEDIKINLAAATQRRALSMDIAGYDAVRGFPVLLNITSEMIADAVQPILTILIETIAALIADAPVALAADLLDVGIVLTGGGANLFGLDILIAERLGMPCRTAKNAPESGIDGVYRAMTDDAFEKLIEIKK